MSENKKQPTEAGTAADELAVRSGETCKTYQARTGKSDSTYWRRKQTQQDAPTKSIPNAEAGAKRGVGASAEEIEVLLKIVETLKTQVEVQTGQIESQTSQIGQALEICQKAFGARSEAIEFILERQEADIEWRGIVIDRLLAILDRLAPPETERAQEAA